MESKIVNWIKAGENGGLPILGWNFCGKWNVSRAKIILCVSQGCPYILCTSL